MTRRRVTPLPRVVGLLASLLLGPACACQEPEAVVELSPRLEVSSTRVDFGDVWMGDAAHNSVFIVNSGTAPLSLRAITFDSEAPFALVGAPPPDVLEPTEAVTLDVQFVPLVVGETTGHIVIDSDTPEGESTIALVGVGQETPVCEDSRVCMTSTFDYVLEACVASPREGACDDGNVCMQNQMCVSGRCLGSPRVCPTAGGCVLSGCDQIQGCTTTRVHAMCDVDDNPCTEGVCHDDGSCTTQMKDDFTPCADTFSCASGVQICQSGVCVALPAEGFPCSDGNLCTTEDTCSGGVCAPGEAVVGPPALVDVAPLLDFHGVTWAVGPVLVSNSALGLVIWETDGGSSTLSVRAVVDSLSCKKDSIIALSSTRMACVSEGALGSKFFVVDVTDGEILDVREAPPNADGESRFFTSPVFAFDGAVYAVVVASYQVRTLVRASDADGTLQGFSDVLPLTGNTLAVGGRFIVDSTLVDMYTPPTVPQVIDLAMPAAAAYSYFATFDAYQRTAGHFALVTMGSSSYVHDLDLAPESLVNGGSLGFFGYPDSVAVEGYWHSRVDLQDDALIGLVDGADVVRVQALTPDVVEPPTLAVPGASHFKRIGDGLWLIGNGRAVKWRAGSLIEEIVWNGAIAPADAHVIGGQPHLVVGPHRVDRMVEMGVHIDGTLRFGATDGPDFGEGDAPRAGVWCAANESCFASSSSSSATELRVVTVSGAADFLVSGIAHVSSGATRLGGVDDLIVDHRDDDEGARIEVRRHAPGGAELLPVISTLVIDDGYAELLALSLGDETPLSLEDWGVAPRRQFALDAQTRALAVVDTVEVEAYVLEESGAFMQPPLTWVLLEHARARVISLANPEEPVVVHDTVVTLPERVSYPEYAIDMRAGVMGFLVVGLVTNDAGASAWLPSLAILRTHETNGWSASATLFFQHDARPLLRLLRHDGVNTIDFVMSKSVLRLDMTGDGTPSLLVDLPEAPIRVLVLDGALYSVGATTVSLLSPTCP
jgi:hypothetical protein